MADPNISARDRAEIARVSAHAIDQQREVTIHFPDLDVALELRDSKRHHRELAYAHASLRHSNPQLVETHEQEMERLRERMRTIVKSIHCPDWYGENDLSEDRKLAAELEKRRETAPLTPDDDNEKARAVARIDAFVYRRSQTPEAVARSRKLKLKLKRITHTITTEEETELEELRAQYPDEYREPTQIVRALEAFIEKYRLRDNRRS